MSMPWHILAGTQTLVRYGILMMKYILPYCYANCSYLSHSHYFQNLSKKEFQQNGCIPIEKWSSDPSFSKDISSLPRQVTNGIQLRFTAHYTANHTTVGCTTASPVPMASLSSSAGRDPSALISSAEAQISQPCLRQISRRYSHLPNAKNSQIVSTARISMTCTSSLGLSRKRT